MSFVSRLSLPFAALALVSVASAASALTLTRADVTGPTGTIWTTAPTGNYTLFLQSPGLGDYINPNGEAISRDVPSGVSRILLAGEGFLPGTTADSDPFYNLTLTFDDGQTLLGKYTPSTNTFNGGTSIVSDGTTFTLIEFSYRRFLGDAVQANVATPGGDGNDYVGNFRIEGVAVTGAVPEPATWGLMIVGFGMVGAAARRRNRTSVTA